MPITLSPGLPLWGYTRGDTYAAPVGAQDFFFAIDPQFAPLGATQWASHTPLLSELRKSIFLQPKVATLDLGYDMSALRALA